MKAQDRKAIIQEITPLVPLLVGGGIKMIATPTIGYIVLGLVAEFYWFYVLQKNWACIQPFRQKIHYQIAGYALIAIVLGGSAIHAYTHGDKPHSPPAAATNENSPGAVAIGGVNGDVGVSIYQSDPNEIRAIKETAEETYRELLELKAGELWKLEREYDFGFVLVAFPNEVDGTRVKPFSDRIDGDWNKCRILSDPNGVMWLEIPRLSIRGPDPGGINFNNYFTALPAVPGFKMGVAASKGIGMNIELLKTKPVGICVVIGFKKEDRQPE